MLVFPIAFAVLVGLWALRRMGQMTPRETRIFQRQLLGAGLCAVALFMLVRGELWPGLTTLGVGAGLLGFTHVLPQGFQQEFWRKRNASTPPSANMDRAEALNVLGLKSGATPDEIKSAHKRLQRANHPDAGGTDYLAGKINQARDVLLNS